MTTLSTSSQQSIQTKWHLSRGFFRLSYHIYRCPLFLHFINSPLGLWLAVPQGEQAVWCSNLGPQGWFLAGVSALTGGPLGDFGEVSLRCST